MKTTVTARHCEITDELRDRALEVMNRFEKLSPHALDGDVVFDVGPEGQSAELRLHVRRGQILVGTGVAGDHRTALDRAEDKLRKQLERATQSKKPRRAQTNL